MRICILDGGLLSRRDSPSEVTAPSAPPPLSQHDADHFQPAKQAQFTYVWKETGVRIHILARCYPACRAGRENVSLAVPFSTAARSPLWYRSAEEKGRRNSRLDSVVAKTGFIEMRSHEDGGKMRGRAAQQEGEGQRLTKVCEDKCRDKINDKRKTTLRAFCSGT